MEVPFSELTARLEKELYRLHYNEQSIKYYRSMWRRIAVFLESEKSAKFTEEAGLHFLDPARIQLQNGRAATLCAAVISTLPSQQPASSARSGRNHSIHKG
ncbi:hypothetical protein [Paenibacillus sp. GP183]|uniref:hypothetical protein n=1 Tax=Paenibacillus sp. GP183 TaxID=1882751 RepID=UPI00209B3853|nr:hypothetical protein [Paenibacillus sp. GP183]